MATAHRVDRPRAAAGGVGSEILDRTPPHSLDAEKAVLGSLLLVPEVCDEVALLVRPSDFYSDAHEKIFGHMLALHEDGKRVDVTLLVNRLKDAGQLESIGGVPYLADIADFTATAANAEYYAQIVRDKSTLRSLILTSTDILRDTYDTTIEPRELLAQAEQKMFAIYDRRDSGEVITMNQVMQEAFDRINARAEGDFQGVATGFLDLDAVTGGLHPGELVILAARPSMGKTALALNLADNVSVAAGTCTLVVSLEMSRLELGQRMLSARSEVYGNKFRSGFMTPADRDRLTQAANELSAAPLHIDDTPSRNVTEIAATARRLKRRSELGLIIIDYLQLIEPDDPRDPRQEQVAKMARRLKGMARELDVPVLCLAQLNRQAEQTKDNTPRLSHLRESGAIEQDADVVMFIHREEYYLTPAQRDDPNMQNVKGKAKIIIAKQRNGPTDTIELLWFQDYTCFKNAAKQYEEF